MCKGSNVPYIVCNALVLPFLGLHKVINGLEYLTFDIYRMLIIMMSLDKALRKRKHHKLCEHHIAENRDR